LDYFTINIRIISQLDSMTLTMLG